MGKVLVAIGFVFLYVVRVAFVTGCMLWARCEYDMDFVYQN